MTHQEALKHKEEAENSADESVRNMFHIAIVPADTTESNRFIEKYLNNPDQFDDYSCKDYSKEDNYEVVSFGKEGNA